MFDYDMASAQPWFKSPLESSSSKIASTGYPVDSPGEWTSAMVILGISRFSKVCLSGMLLKVNSFKSMPNRYTFYKTSSRSDDLVQLPC